MNSGCQYQQTGYFPLLYGPSPCTNQFYSMQTTCTSYRSAFCLNSYKMMMTNLFQTTMSTDWKRGLSSSVQTTSTSLGSTATLTARPQIASGESNAATVKVGLPRVIPPLLDHVLQSRVIRGF